jgi:hypothetical protein
LLDKEIVMTPNDIEVLIHCYVTPCIHPRIEAPAVIGAMRAFASEGILEKQDGEMYSVTDKGEALMNMLCSTPLPVQVWADGCGNIINKEI